MLELLIVVLVAGIGFASGYGVRELISRRRRSRQRVDAPRARSSRRRARPDDAVHAEALLAANDDISARGRHLPTSTQQPDTPPDELDGAVRDLLGELGRRTAKPSSAPHRRRH